MKNQKLVLVSSNPRDKQIYHMLKRRDEQIYKLKRQNGGITILAILLMATLIVLMVTSLIINGKHTKELAAITNKDSQIEVVSEPPVNRFQNIDLSGEELALLAQTLYCECRGESDEGQRAVCEVIFNRMLSDEFPNTLEGVLYQENQFECVPLLNEAPVKEKQLQIIAQVMSSESLTDENVVFFATTPLTSDIAFHIGGHYFCR